MTVLHLFVSAKNRYQLTPIPVIQVKDIKGATPPFVYFEKIG